MAEYFYHSSEVRWLIAGQEHRAAMEDWFTRQGALRVVNSDKAKDAPADKPFVSLERLRKDQYLRIPDCDSVGVKLREGRLEVKALVTGPRPYANGPAVGRADQWVKWSMTPAKPIRETLVADLLASAPWITVNKRRFLQKYDFDSGECIPVSPAARPQAGCNIEVTHLDFEPADDAWTTFGFEAFGGSAQVTGILDASVGHYFATHGTPPVPLAPMSSLNYPAWLVSLRHG